MDESSGSQPSGIERNWEAVNLFSILCNMLLPNWISRRYADTDCNIAIIRTRPVKRDWSRKIDRERRRDWPSLDTVCHDLHRVTLIIGQKARRIWKNCRIFRNHLHVPTSAALEFTVFRFAFQTIWILWIWNAFERHTHRLGAHRSTLDTRRILKGIEIDDIQFGSSISPLVLNFWPWRAITSVWRQFVCCVRLNALYRELVWCESRDTLLLPD